MCKRGGESSGFLQWLGEFQTFWSCPCFSRQQHYEIKLLIPRTFKLSFPSYLKCMKWCILDSVDKIIWILPFLSVLDVISTLYVEGLGYSLVLYEAGFFAGYFVGAGLTYVYIVVYLSSVSIVAYVLWYIKNKKLNSSVFFGKVIFLFWLGLHVIFTLG